MLFILLQVILFIYFIDLGYVWDQTRFESLTWLIRQFSVPKVGCVVPIVIWPEFHTGQYRDDDDREILRDIIHTPLYNGVLYATHFKLFYWIQ